MVYNNLLAQRGGQPVHFATFRREKMAMNRFALALVLLASTLVSADPMWPS